MPSRAVAVTTGVLVLGMWAGAAWAVSCLPDGLRIPIHYGLDGLPNYRAPAEVALFILPAIASVVWLIRAVLPRIDPRGQNLIKSGKAYGTIWLAATVVLGLLEAHMIAVAFGLMMAPIATTVAIMGGFFVVMGNVLGKLRWNYTVGIRTPWTLADETVWDKTHRFGGWAFVIGGLVLMIGAFAKPGGERLLPLLLIAVVISLFLLTIGRSYWLWHKRRDKGAARAKP